MRYQGSKLRLFPKFKSLMNIQPKDVYVEPFVGGANSFFQVDCARKIGADINQEIIEFLELVRDGWVPPSEAVSKSLYLDIKANGHLDRGLYLFCAYSLSFGGKRFAGYTPQETNPQTFAQARTLAKQSLGLKGSELICCDYRELEIPSDSVVYLDPPYKDTLGYSKAGDFDSDQFLSWAKDLSRRCRVFLSEGTEISDFRVLWSLELKNRMNSFSTGGKSRIEYLYEVKP